MARGRSWHGDTGPDVLFSRFAGSRLPATKSTWKDLPAPSIDRAPRWCGLGCLPACARAKPGSGHVAAAWGRALRGYTGARGEVAQLVEHTAENRGVAGSIPALATSSSFRS